MVFLFLLAGSVALRIWLTCFPKVAYIYNDELFYLKLAQNIWNEGALLVYRTPIDYTKVLYSLVIAPFYAIGDSVGRTTAISVFNAVLVSSALIPGWLTARRVCRTDGQAIAALAALALSPNLMLSQTFMAENLYIPLVMWGMYALLRAFSRDCPGPGAGVALGLLGCAMYFAKEAGLAFWGAALALYLRCILKGKGNRKAAGVSLLCFIGALVLPWVLVRFVALGNLGYSYAHQVGESSQSAGALLLLESTGKMLLYFLVSWVFFPVGGVFLPGEKEEARKRLRLYAAVYAAQIALGIAWAVTPTDGSVPGEIRIELRYFVAAAWPFLLLFISGEDSGRPKKPVLWIAGAAVCAAIAAWAAETPKTYSPVDFPTLWAVRGLADIAENPDLWLKILCAAVILCGGILYAWRGRKALLVLAVPLLLGVELAGSILFYRVTVREGGVTEAQQAAAAELDRTLAGLAREDGSPADILVIHDGSRDLCLLNTYASRDFWAVRAEALAATADAEGRTDLSARPFERPVGGFASGTYEADRADYILVIGYTPELKAEYHEDITPEGTGDMAARLYRSKDPGVIVTETERKLAVGQEARFYEPDPTGKKYIVSGFYDTEQEYTWNQGRESVLAFHPDTEEPEDLWLTVEWIYILGQQPCEIMANDTMIHYGTVSQENPVLKLYIPADAWPEGEIVLTFSYPEATEAGEGDARILATAFRSIRIDRAEETEDEDP